MDMVAVVKVNGQVQCSGGTLAAFVGGEVRGVQATADSPPFGDYVGQPVMYNIRVHSNAPAANEAVTFKFALPSGEILDVASSAGVQFDLNHHGNAISPTLQGRFTSCCVILRVSKNSKNGLNVRPDLFL